MSIESTYYTNTSVRFAEFGEFGEEVPEVKVIRVPPVRVDS
jgi:hypothetical protein